MRVDRRSLLCGIAGFPIVGAMPADSTEMSALPVLIECVRVAIRRRNQAYDACDRAENRLLATDVHKTRVPLTVPADGSDPGGYAEVRFGRAKIERAIRREHDDLFRRYLNGRLPDDSSWNLVTIEQSMADALVELDLALIELEAKRREFGVLDAMEAISAAAAVEQEALDALLAYVPQTLEEASERAAYLIGADGPWEHVAPLEDDVRLLLGSMMARGPDPDLAVES